MRYLLAALLLLPAALTGCIGGEDPGPALGTYTVQAADAAGGRGMHAGHGGAAGGLSHVAELWHFNASHAETFEVDDEHLGFVVDWELTGGSFELRLIDGAGTVVSTVTGQADAGDHEAVLEDIGPGTWSINVTATDATGTLEAHAGDPAALGLVQAPPIVFDETLTADSTSYEWFWDAKGNATLEISATFLPPGGVTFVVVDGMAEPVARLELEGPEDTRTETIQGMPGEWQVKLQTDTYTGQLTMSLTGSEGG